MPHSTKALDQLSRQPTEEMANDPLQMDVNGLPLTQWSIGSITVSSMSTLNAELSSTIHTGDTVTAIICPSYLLSCAGRCIFLTQDNRRHIAHAMNKSLAQTDMNDPVSKAGFQDIWVNDESRLFNAFSNAFVALRQAFVLSKNGSIGVGSMGIDPREQIDDQSSLTSDGNWISSILVRSEQASELQLRHFVITFDGDMEPFAESER